MVFSNLAFAHFSIEEISDVEYLVYYIQAILSSIVLILNF